VDLLAGAITSKVRCVLLGPWLCYVLGHDLLAQQAMCMYVRNSAALLELCCWAVWLMNFRQETADRVYVERMQAVAQTATVRKYG
jgi:hypothetical protein